VRDNACLSNYRSFPRPLAHFSYPKEFALKTSQAVFLATFLFLVEALYSLVLVLSSYTVRFFFSVFLTIEAEAGAFLFSLVLIPIRRRLRRRFSPRRSRGDACLWFYLSGHSQEPTVPPSPFSSITLSPGDNPSPGRVYMFFLRFSRCQEPHPIPHGIQAPADCRWSHRGFHSASAGVHCGSPLRPPFYVPLVEDILSPQGARILRFSGALVICLLTLLVQAKRGALPLPLCLTVACPVLIVSSSSALTPPDRTQKEFP